MEKNGGTKQSSLKLFWKKEKTFLIRQELDNRHKPEVLFNTNSSTNNINFPLTIAISKALTGETNSSVICQPSGTTLTKIMMTSNFNLFIFQWKDTTQEH